MTMHYRLTATHLHARLEQVGSGGTAAGWLSVGFPQAPGVMLGAIAIIGMQGASGLPSSSSSVKLYYLGGKGGPSDITPLAAASQTLEEASVQAEGGTLSVAFRALLTEGWLGVGNGRRLSIGNGNTNVIFARGMAVPAQLNWHGAGHRESVTMAFDHLYPPRPPPTLPPPPLSPPAPSTPPVPPPALPPLSPPPPPSGDIANEGGYGNTAGGVSMGVTIGAIAAALGLIVCILLCVYYRRVLRKGCMDDEEPPPPPPGWAPAMPQAPPDKKVTKNRGAIARAQNKRATMFVQIGAPSNTSDADPTSSVSMKISSSAHPQKPAAPPPPQRAFVLDASDVVVSKL